MSESASYYCGTYCFVYVMSVWFGLCSSPAVSAVTVLGWKCGANVVKEYIVLMFQLLRDQVSFSVVFLYVQ